MLLLECQLTGAGSDYCENKSLPVELSLFIATAENGFVILKWKTESEIENLGFNIYRSLVDTSGYIKINKSLIAGAITTSNSN